MALVFGFFNIAGTIVDMWGGGHPVGSWQTIEHGWPWTFLVRVADQTESRFGIFQATEFSFNPNALLANLAVVTLMTTAIVMVVARLRFTISGLLLAVAFIAGNLAYVRFLTHVAARESDFYELLEAADIGSDSRYIGPVWLARLTGSIEPFGLMLLCIDSVRIRNEAALQNPQVLATLGNLRYLELIETPDDTIWMRDEFHDRYCGAAVANDAHRLPANDRQAR